MKQRHKQILRLLTAITLPWLLKGDAPAHPDPYQILHPDGSLSVPLFLKGSFDFHWEEDSEGYIVVSDPQTNHKVYAIQNEETGRLEPSGKRVGMGNPSRWTGLIKRDDLVDITKRDEDEEANVERRRRLPSTKGTLRNLVVLMRFQDHTNRTLPSNEDISILFNSDDDNKSICPTGSIRKVYRVSSYDQLKLESTITPWVTVSQTEAEAADGISGKTHKLWDSIRDALTLVDELDDIDLVDFDQDTDGQIDAITIMHSGYDACFGATDCFENKREDRIWSHKRMMYPEWRSKDGIAVSDYNISPALYKVCGHKVNHIGVIAHELGHFLGIADLYDRTAGGCGIGYWGLMGAGSGVDRTGRYPPVMGAWSKIQLNWVEPIEITEPGRYTLQSSTKSDTIYKLQQGFPDREYLLIENRQPESFDGLIPQGGLAIWHVEETAKYEQRMDPNHARGWPGQPNWPYNNNHYKVALLQADGLYHLEHGKNCGDGGDLFHGNGVNYLHPSKSCDGPFPNTDAYQSGDILQTHHVIENITESGEFMSFDYALLPTKHKVCTRYDAPVVHEPATCESWCDVLPDKKMPWNERCKLTKCEKCSQCPDKKTTTTTTTTIMAKSFEEVSTSLAAMQSLPCKNWCENALGVSWEEKCLLEKHCVGCAQCLAEEF